MQLESVEQLVIWFVGGVIFMDVSDVTFGAQWMFEGTSAPSSSLCNVCGKTLVCDHYYKMTIEIVF